MFATIFLGENHCHKTKFKCKDCSSFIIAMKAIR